MRHVLVMGSSDVLSGLVLALMEKKRAFQFVVVSRHQEELARIMDEAGSQADRLTPIRLDYHNIDRLRRWIAHIQLMNGPLDLVVAREVAPEVLSGVAEEVNAYQQLEWKLVEVVDAAGRSDGVGVKMPGNCRHHVVKIQTPAFPREPSVVLSEVAARILALMGD